ncbi:MAG: hypothetical protein CVV25_09625 [Ignavibacteriae bacterium HGW-Ignavibacteriae-4]|nr:MAG: hypothetical protein CVV25_09625 [Ignavibacteriae bacterium HGW-Ignavibacteriae-4]
MKKYILIIALLFCGFVVSNASILTKNSVELVVGSNPVSILENPSDGMIHIFCAGVDANDNNVYDEVEDEKPSWWTYNPAGSSVEPTMVKEFDNYFVSPFKPTVDTIKGYTTVILPFAASKTDGQFTGNGFVQGFQMKNTVPAFKTEVTNGEFLSYERQIANTISVVRVNGNDSLIVRNELNNQVDAFELKGDVIEYATFYDEDDSQYIAPLYFDGDSSSIAVYEIDKDLNVSFLFNSKRPLFGVVKDSVSSFTGNGKQIFMTSNSGGHVTMSELNKEKNEFLAFPQRVGYESGINNYIIGITDDLHIISTNGKDIIAIDLNWGKGTPNNEMHHSKFEIGYTQYLGNQVYCASSFDNDKKGGRIAIYDLINEPNQDVTLYNQAYVGYQPLALFDLGLDPQQALYTVSLGIDYNFDGIINEEEGDLPATLGTNFSFGSLDKIDRTKEFYFPINFPLNSNISSDGNIVLPSGNKAYFYNVDAQKITDSLDAGMYVTCAFSVLDYLVLGQRDYTENKSYIRIKKGDFIDVKTEVGANVIDCIVYQNASGFGVVSLSEGNFGQPDSKINIVKLSTMGIGENTAIDVGTGGNSIVANADQTKAAVVMNGSHEIHILNLITGEIDLTFSTGTTGYGGPRESVFNNDRLYVTTYSNQIMVFDVNSGSKLSSINIDGNSEGLFIEKNFLMVANNQYSNYEASNRIFAHDINKITSVEEAIPSEQTIRVYPHPVSNDFHLVSDDLAGTNDIAIINSQGKIVATYSGSSNGAIALNADALGLTSGNYTAVINGTRAVRFVVIK